MRRSISNGWRRGRLVWSGALGTVAALAAGAAAWGIEPESDAGRARRRSPVVEVFERCREAVVNISSTKVSEVRYGRFGVFFDEIFEFAPQKQITQSVGSGFLIHRDGYIVTNEHVVARTVERKIIFADGQELDADIVALDSEHDLAVLKVYSKKPLPFLPLGRSDDLMIGETVVAIGNPLGYQHTCTTGIVSALDRELSFQQGRVYRGLIQTDASINPGNSGGPLLNINGELIGINTAIRGDAQNIGFAIPVDHLRKLLPWMLDIERIRRVRLGLHLAGDGDEGESGADGGVRIAQVDAGSPADEAGLRAGDVILAIDEQPTPTFLDAFSILDQTPAGKSFAMTIGREGRRLTKSVEIAAIPKPDGLKLMVERFGLRVREMTVRDLRVLHIRQPVGLVVTGVQRGSRAAEIGIEPGDLVMRVAGREVRSLEFVGHLLEVVEPGSVVDMSVGRVEQGVLYRYELRMRAN